MNRAQRRHPDRFGLRPVTGQRLPDGAVVTQGKQRLEKFLEEVGDAEARRRLRERGLTVPEAPIERVTRQKLAEHDQHRTPSGLILPAGE